MTQNWQDKNVLVTGADGFIGSHLVERMVRLGAKVRAFVLYNSWNSWGWIDSISTDLRSEIEVVSGDVRDFDLVRQATSNCEVVFHLAALIAIPYSYIAPASYLEANVRGTLNVVQAAKEAGVERLVHTSSSEVYGTAKYVPIDEEHPLVAQSPYAATKVGADQLALSFHRSFGVPVVVARPFNAYGPRQSARAIIPTVITQLMANPCRIKLGSLHPTRDFSYVEDTVSGLVRLAECSAAVGDVVNIGSGFEISIGDTVRLIADILGAHSLEIETDADRVRPPGSEVERLFANIEKMNRLTGWKPSYGSHEGFRCGLEATVEWFAGSGARASYKDSIYNL